MERAVSGEAPVNAWRQRQRTGTAGQQNEPSLLVLLGIMVVRAQLDAALASALGPYSILRHLRGFFSNYSRESRRG